MKKTIVVVMIVAIALSIALMLFGELHEQRNTEQQAAIDARLQSQRDRYTKMSLVPVGEYLRSPQTGAFESKVLESLTGEQKTDLQRLVHDALRYLHHPNAAAYFDLKYPSPHSTIGIQASNFIAANKIIIDTTSTIQACEQVITYITNRLSAPLEKIAPDSLHFNVTSQDVDPLRNVFSYAHTFYSGPLVGFVGDLAVAADYPNITTRNGIPCTTVTIHFAGTTSSEKVPFPLFISAYWSKQTGRWIPFQTFSPNTRFCTVL